MNGRAYYNEFDPFAAQWLRNLIAAELIAPGDVDERSIVDVRADDLRGYVQCHFFAGIGGWSYALRLAGWPDARPVWTGSCPCQPFSAAGKGKAADDERHLWPAWLPLIAEHHPATVFGEQVEAAVGWGWLDAVFADLEAEGYACGATVLPACSVGAPHIRQRLWFVAHAVRGGADDGPGAGVREEAAAVGGDRDLPRQSGWAGLDSADGRMGNSDEQRSQGRRERGQRAGQRAAGPPSVGGVMGNASGHEQRQPRLAEAGEQRTSEAGGSGPRSFWSDALWLPCTDGKARPTQSGIFPLAHGVPNRVGTLRGAGNAIVPQTAAEFIRAYLET